MGQVSLKPILKKILIAFLLAAAGCLGTLATQSISSDAYALFHPSPYRYLEGAYDGSWEWADQNHQAQSTHDTVFFESTADGKLVGHGIDPQLGTYTFKGNLYSGHISAAYLSDMGSAEPAQSGSFELDQAQKNPLILKGVWTGYYNGTRIAGTAVLTKKPD